MRTLSLPGPVANAKKGQGALKITPESVLNGISHTLEVPWVRLTTFTVTDEGNMSDSCDVVLEVFASGEGVDSRRLSAFSPKISRWFEFLASTSIALDGELRYVMKLYNSNITTKNKKRFHYLDCGLKERRLPLIASIRVSFFRKFLLYQMVKPVSQIIIYCR